MRRREFIALGGAAVGWPLVARAQQAGKVWRIGFISGLAAPPSIQKVAAFSGFLRGMEERGYAEGKDFIIEWRFAEGQYEKFPSIAAELVRMKVDVIVLGTPAAVRAAQSATNTIPIVMLIVTDPVGHGYVKSLAHPGGNTTGLASSIDDVMPKHVELLATAVPGLSRLGILINPGNPTSTAALHGAQAAAHGARLASIVVKARNKEEVENAFGTLLSERASALVVVADAFLNAAGPQIAELAIRARLPAIFHQRENVEAGGFMSYGQPLSEFGRGAAAYVDKIIKGAHPSDLPIEQPTRFYLVVNLKTAKAIGLSIPQSFLARADELIE